MPVITQARVDEPHSLKCFAWTTPPESCFLSLSVDEFAKTDPLLLNLTVASGIPELRDLDIAAYQDTLDRWANEFRVLLPSAEAEFAKSPWDWKNDIDFFRLGFLAQYLDLNQSVQYHPEHRERHIGVRYTAPGLLFLHGIIDTKMGTCATMAALFVAMAWRMNWPVSLACVSSHFIARFDDGIKTHNIEATDTGQGGFASGSDEDYLRNHSIPPSAIACGSDLRAISPREMLGVFVSFRARYFDNTTQFDKADRDFSLARWLFPNNRAIHLNQVRTSIQTSNQFFLRGEPGHIDDIASFTSCVQAAQRRTENGFSMPSALSGD